MRRLGKGEIVQITTTAMQCLDAAGALTGGVLPESSTVSALALLFRARTLTKSALGDIDAAIKKLKEVNE